MPNHTTNILYVSGDRKELERFRDTVHGNNPNIKALLKEESKFRIALMQKTLAAHPGYSFTQSELKSAQDTYNKLEKGTYENTDVINFQGTVPMPVSMHITSPAHSDEEKNMEKDNMMKYGAPNWYDWAIANWGTKWNAYDIEDIEDNGSTLIYRFQTAWSPPIKWLEKTSKLFPKLTFRIAAADEGGGFFIDNTIVDGDTTDDNDMEEHDWRMEFDEEYAETYNSIFNNGYEEGIKYALDQKGIDWRFEKKLLDFIKDEDLPLFISFPWENDEVGEDYAERVRTLNKEEVKKSRKAKNDAKKAHVNG